MPDQNWLILLHHLPPKPDYFRAKVRRRLQRIGALPLKNSAYVLPDRDDTAEDFQWLSQEILDEGGDALVLSARLLNGITDEDLISRFKAESDAAYEGVIAAVREAAGEHDGDESSRRLQRSRLKAKIEELSRTDFFASDKRDRAEQEVSELGALPRSDRAEPEPASSPAAMHAGYTGRTWVTRSGVFVDRMASAWMIRRMIDSAARFRFIADGRAAMEPGEIRFDMPGAEFTHRGDRCTFEVLAERFAPDDAGIAAIAEVVHDIDLKDEKFGRPEVDGVSAILRGIAQANADDETRIALAAKVFDGLYAGYPAP